MHGADRGSTTHHVATATLTPFLVVALTAPVWAHVQPAVDENNRYIKVTPLGDRVRLSYTVFLGERPGAALRRRLDRDRDQELSDAETAPYGEELAGHVRTAVTVTIDGRPTPIAWTTVDVGLGTPAVSGGALSVDLVGWICTGGGAAPRLTLHDTLVLDRPGDSELRLEDGPGVHFGERRLGGRPLDKLDATWTGSGGPLTEGLEVTWRVDGAAPRPADGRCTESKHAPRRWWAWGVAGAIAAAATAVAVALRRQRKVNG